MVYLVQWLCEGSAASGAPVAEEPEFGDGLGGQYRYRLGVVLPTEQGNRNTEWVLSSMVGCEGGWES